MSLAVFWTIARPDARDKRRDGFAERVHPRHSHAENSRQGAANTGLENSRRKFSARSHWGPRAAAQRGSASARGGSGGAAAAPARAGRGWLRDLRRVPVAARGLHVRTLAPICARNVYSQLHYPHCNTWNVFWNCAGTLRETTFSRRVRGTRTSHRRRCTVHSGEVLLCAPAARFTRPSRALLLRPARRALAPSQTRKMVLFENQLITFPAVNA